MKIVIIKFISLLFNIGNNNLFNVLNKTIYTIIDAHFLFYC